MFGRTHFFGAFATVWALCLWTSPVAAQSVFGTHAWQMQPYCNVVTLTLSPSPNGARVEGFDNLCGASDRAGVVGMASQNAAGNVTMNFTIVTAPNARPVHVTAVVSPVNGGGVWTDSGGSTGTMAYGASTPGLPLRPVPVTQLGPNVITTLEIAPGAVGGTDINTAEVQSRVSGSCAAGQAMTAINVNGTVTCASITGGGGATVSFKAGGHAQSNYLTPFQYSDVTWTSTRFNVGGGTFSAPDTAYTVPSAGLYLLTATVKVTGFQTSGTYCGGFRVSGTVVGLGCYEYAANAQIDTNGISVATTAQLAAGDTVTVGVIPLMAGGNGLRIDAGNQAEGNFTVTKLQ